MTLWFIRALFLAFFAAAVPLEGPASAAPTCQDRNGLTIKCGTEGAMPVGWSLPYDERPFAPPALSTTHLLALIATPGLLFALIALLPEFDGTQPSDWDEHEGEDHERSSADH